LEGFRVAALRNGQDPFWGEKSFCEIIKRKNNFFSCLITDLRFSSPPQSLSIQTTHKNEKKKTLNAENKKNTGLDHQLRQYL